METTTATQREINTLIMSLEQKGCFDQLKDHEIARIKDQMNTVAWVAIREYKDNISDLAAKMQESFK